MVASVDSLPPGQRDSPNANRSKYFFLRYMSFAKARFWNCWLLMKLVVEQFGLPDDDLMISSLYVIDEGAFIKLGKSRIRAKVQSGV